MKRCVSFSKGLQALNIEFSARACLQKELRAQGVPFHSEVSIPVIYKGEPVDCRYRIDFWFADELVVELKSVE
jgi:GxxExxY protein